MFWIPYLSITIFFVVLISSFFIGFRIGWRAALFFSLIFWTLTGIFIGIAYGIYNILIWPLYRQLYFDENVSQSPYLNLLALAKYYRTNLVLTSIGLFSPFILFIAWVIYFLSKKKINNYLSIQTQEVSSYKKNIIQTPNIVRSRVLGLAVLGTSSLFSSSLLASSVNTIATPYKNANNFTRFNDALGLIYSFGLAKNSSKMGIANNFFQNQKDLEFVSRGVNSFLSFSTDGQTHEVPNLDIINNLFQNQNFNKLLKESAQATEVVFGSMIYKQSINLLKLDEKTSRNSLEVKEGYQNQVGFDNQENIIFINEIEQFLANKNPLIKSLPNKVKSLLEKKIESFFIKFEETFPVKNYNQQVKERKESEKLLQKQIKFLQETIAKITNTKEAIDKSNQDLYKLTGVSNIEILSNYNDLIIQTKSIISELQAKKQVASQEFELANQKQEIIADDLQNKETSFFDNDQQKEDLEFQKVTLENEIKDLEKKLSQSPKNQNIKSSIQDKQKELQNIKDKLNNLNSSWQKTKKDYEEALNKFDESSKELEQKIDNLDSINFSLNQKENKAESIFNLIKQNEQILEGLKQERYTLENKQVSSWNEENDGSIKWFDLKLQHEKQVEEELLQILNDKKQVYESIKERFLKAYQNWLEK